MFFLFSVSLLIHILNFIFLSYKSVSFNLWDWAILLFLLSYAFPPFCFPLKHVVFCSCFIFYRFYYGSSGNCPKSPCWLLFTPIDFLNLYLSHFSKQTSTLAHSHVPFGEGNSTPLQYFCLENPINRGAWRAMSMGSRVGHDWATKPPPPCPFSLISHSSVLVSSRTVG